jgi:hypothetical protein
MNGAQRQAGRSFASRRESTDEQAPRRTTANSAGVSRPAVRRQAARRVRVAISAERKSARRRRDRSSDSSGPGARSALRSVVLAHASGSRRACRLSRIRPASSTPATPAIAAKQVRGTAARDAGVADEATVVQVARSRNLVVFRQRPALLLARVRGWDPTPANCPRTAWLEYASVNASGGVRGLTSPQAVTAAAPRLADHWARWRGDVETGVCVAESPTSGLPPRPARQRSTWRRGSGDHRRSPSPWAAARGGCDARGR